MHAWTRLRVASLVIGGLSFPHGAFAQDQAAQLGRLLLRDNYSIITLRYRALYADGPTSPTTKGGYHPGIDYRAQTLLPVFSPVNGAVDSFDPDGRNLGRLTIRIDGTSDYFILLHLSHVGVAAGQRVRVGDPIGTTGSTGAPAHLHAELRTGKILGAYYFTSPNDPGVNNDPSSVVGLFATAPSAAGTGCLPAAAYRDGVLLRSASGPTVYVMDNGRRRAIPDEATFRARGWRFESVVLISVQDLARIPQGPDIPRSR